MTQAGWYADPHGSPDHLRWFDGAEWTEHLQALVAPAASPAPVAQAQMPPSIVSGHSPHELQVLPSDEPMHTDLNKKVSRFVRQQSALLPGETIAAVLGMGDQVILATDSRLLVIKVGWTAGAGGGGRIAAFDYADVTGLQANFGRTMGTLSVQSPGYGATQTGDYWNSKNQQDPLKLPNVIPWPKANHSKYARELAYIDRRLAEAKGRGIPDSRGTSPDFVAELQRLAELHRFGALSDDEFALAKAKLLSS